MSTSASVDASPTGPPEQPQWLSVGRHRCYSHGDMVFLQPCGVASESEMAQLLDPVWQTQQAHGRAFLILDAREAVPASPQLRRFLAEWHREHPTRGRTILFGAGPLVRGTVALLNAAARILARRAYVQELFVASESEAWAALQQERQRFLQDTPQAR